MNPIASQLSRGDPFAPTSWGAFGPGWLWISVEETGGQNVPVNPATEREIANPITPAKLVNLGIATEAELAQAITPLKPIDQAIGTATEIELGREITPRLGEPIVLGPVTCEVLMPTATCSVHGPAASCAILSPTATCEFTI